MKMKQFKQGIKQRREARLRLLKEKQRKYGASIPLPTDKKRGALSSTWSDYSGEHAYRDATVHARNRQTLQVLLKIICSLVLVTVVYLIMRSEHPELSATQHFVREVMSRDFNVQGVIGWYEQNLGTEPTFLPRIIRSDEEQKAPQSDYVIPVSGGLVISPFGQGQQGIMVKTVSTAMPIEVVKEGWVVFVGEKEGLGQTVIIDHLDGEESWYGQLQGIQVQLHDWVDQGEKIGYSTPIQKESRQGVFYFALKKDAVFIDPLGVISFD